MTKGTELQPGFTATTLYDNFDAFIEHYERMNTWRRFDSLPILALVKLARDDFQKAKRVYDWAVRVPCLRHLGGWYREHDDTQVTLSENGMKQVEIAASRFGQNPMVALTIVEGVLILEKTASWAEKRLKSLNAPLSLDELRARPLDPEEEAGQVPWLHQLYDEVTGQTMFNLRNYIEARDTAIVMSIVGLASGSAPTEDDIYRAMRGRPHSRKSAKDQRRPITRKEFPISDPRFTVEWVLGRDQKEIPF